MWSCGFVALLSGICCKLFVTSWVKWLLLKGVWKELLGSFVVGSLGVLFRDCFVGCFVGCLASNMCSNGGKSVVVWIEVAVLL